MSYLDQARLSSGKSYSAELRPEAPLRSRRYSSPISRVSLQALLITGLITGVGSPSLIQAQPAPVNVVGAPENPFPNRSPAVDFHEGVEWLNTAGPITLPELRGKVVILDFWTYCCINCMHILPDLKYLEEKYPNELVVIGVHSAKFDNEKETGNIRKAILRYEIEHPVINDAEMQVWQQFRVSAWPTLVIIDPEGMYCGFTRGEGKRDLLDGIVGKLVDYHRAKGTLKETPVQFDLERNRTQPTPLRFPGKLLADAARQRLFISDSGHNRIVQTDLNGQVQAVIGNGQPGWKDGSFAECLFDHPQGMALVGNTLYVADTENHVIRAVDLTTQTVQTLAGVGKQGPGRSGGGARQTTPLNSPWDLCVLNNVLYIAMAGPHQIWSHQLGSETVEVFAGSGDEDVLNGKLSAAALAQPSGISTDGTRLFFVDSEGSAVRQITLNDSPAGGRVTTLAGTSDLLNGRSLFKFGDVDGKGGNALLQHPLGIVYHAGLLYVADSYNHKIKVVDPRTTQCRTLLGAGESGKSLSPLQLSEPAGLTISGENLLIADTNNHRILVHKLGTQETTELVLTGLAPPARPKTAAGPKPRLVLDLPEQALAASDSITLHVQFTFEGQEKLNPLFPATCRVVGGTSSQGEQTLIAGDQLNQKFEGALEGNTAKFQIPLAVPSGQATLDLVVNYGYCETGDSGLCKVDTVQLRVPVSVGAAGGATQLEAVISPTQTAPPK